MVRNTEIAAEAVEKKKSGYESIKGTQDTICRYSKIGKFLPIDGRESNMES